MATVTGTTVEVTIGEYTYRAELDGNRIELFRDGVSAGAATWGGQTIEDFPATLAKDAHEELDAAIRENLGKAWRSGPSVAEMPAPVVHATPNAEPGQTAAPANPDESDGAKPAEIASPGPAAAQVTSLDGNG